MTPDTPAQHLPAAPPLPAGDIDGSGRTDAGPRPRPGLGWTEFLIGALAYLPITMVFGVLLYVVTGGVLLTVPMVALTGVATLATVAVALAPRVRSFAAVGVRATTWRWLLIGLGTGVAAWLVNRFVVLGYMALTGDTSNPQQGLTDAAAGPGLELIGLLLAGAVFVPIAEEMLFRGIGYGALRRYGPWVATIASALIFGLAHGINVVLPAAIIIGVANAVLYERSRSIWPAVVAHGANNAILFVTAALLVQSAQV